MLASANTPPAANADGGGVNKKAGEAMARQFIQSLQGGDVAEGGKKSASLLFVNKSERTKGGSKQNYEE